MVARSRHAAVLQNGQWELAFGRQTTIEDVLQYMITHWQRLQKYPDGDMRFSEPEPRITKFFALALQKHGRTYGIDGIFIPELPRGEVNEEKKILESRGRTDITYFNEKVEPRIQIDIEFKKLKPKPGAKTSRGLYFKDGMLRFVNGIYAKETEVGFMIGLIESDEQVNEIITGIKRGIQEDATIQLLRMLTNKNGKTIISPSPVFPACEFDSRHARDHVPNTNDVLIGHIFLSHRK